MRQRTRNELRCYCRRQPLLATYGLDERGKTYLHVKVYKNRRIFGEILVTGSQSRVQLRCRECMRWFTVDFKESQPELIETVEPDSVAGQAPTGHV